MGEGNWHPLEYNSREIPPGDGRVGDICEVKEKRTYSECLTVGEMLVKELAPFTERIEIVGSVRRKRPLCSDLELLYIPKLEKRKTGLFDEDAAQINLVDKILDEWLASGLISKRPNKAGMLAWGEKNKLAVHSLSGIPLDLFSTTADNWAVSLVIRTGSKETNLRLTSSAIARGGHLNAYGCGVTWKDGTSTPAISEEDVFKMCGVPYIEPHAR